MTYLEFVMKDIERLSICLNEIDRNIADLNIKGVHYLDYGSREEILSQYVGKKVGRIRVILSRVSDKKLNEFILNRELNKLNEKKKVIEEQLRQYRVVEKSFHDGEMREKAFPNNYILTSMLSYFNEIKSNDFRTLLSMIISLFKMVGENNTDFIALIEQNIAENFDSKYQLKDGINLDTLLFMLDKVAKSFNFDDQVAAVLEGLKNEIRNSYVCSKEEQHQKTETNRALPGELEQFIVDGKIVKIAPSLEYFQYVLDKAKINDELKKEYLGLMQSASLEREKNEEKRLLAKFLVDTEQQTLATAYSYLMDSSNPAIAHFIQRLLKDIVSACKYMEIMGENLDFHDSYEAIACKVELLKALCTMNLAQESKNTFYYVLGCDEMPIALRNAEGIDSLQYSRILKLLKSLSLNEDGKEIGSFDGIRVNVLEEKNVGIIYAKEDNTIIILGISADIFGKERFTLNRNVSQKIKDILSKKDDSDFKKAQEAYEIALLQILNLNSLSSDLEIRRLKKAK